MIKDAGIVLRTIPYSDSARILQCFSEGHGLVSLFSRLAKKRPPGHLQSGSFIEFAANEKVGSGLLTLIEARWNPKVPTDNLSGEAAVLWLFTVELMQRSLPERLIHHQLYHRMSAYYAYLSQGDFSLNPLIPLVVISSDLGLADVAMVFRMCDSASAHALQLLGVGRTHDVSPTGNQSSEVFNIELDRFQQHFGIDRMGSLDLIG